MRYAGLTGHLFDDVDDVIAVRFEQVEVTDGL